VHLDFVFEHDGANGIERLEECGIQNEGSRVIGNVLGNHPNKLRPIVFDGTVYVFQILAKVHVDDERFSELPIQSADGG
jgi:hypothetical protein